jgi:transposase-like protein
MTDIMLKRKELTNYHMFKDCPNTTNIIEGFNGHLKDRTRSIRGFKSFHHAKRFLNAYVLHRRLKPLKACSPKFKHLNFKKPLELTAKDEKLPIVF